jgi:hypothetical protein
MLYRLFTLRMQGSASNLERAVPCVTLRNCYVESLLDDVMKPLVVSRHKRARNGMGFSRVTSASIFPLPYWKWNRPDLSKPTQPDD